MKDFSHLDALQARLMREKVRLNAAKNDHEKAFREREIASCEKEIAAEYKFLGIEPVPKNLRIFTHRIYPQSVDRLSSATRPY